MVPRLYASGPLERSYVLPFGSAGNLGHGVVLRAMYLLRLSVFNATSTGEGSWTVVPQGHEAASW